MATILEKTTGLLAFIRTVETGSFTSASRTIGSSPSAIAKSVARLERRLGVPLLQRSTRTLALTAEGSAYYERIAPLLRAIEDADSVVQTVDDARGLLRVTAPSDLGRTLISAWMETFASRHPRLKLELGILDRRVDLIREGYDVAVRAGAISDSGLVGRRLAELPLVLVASPDYIARQGAPRSIDDLRRHACLRYVLAGRPYAWRWRDGTTLVPDGPLDSNDGHALRLAALYGAGIVYLLRATVADDLAAGRLVVVLPDLPMPTLPVHALHAFGRQIPARVRLFIDFLVDRIGALERQTPPVRKPVKEEQP
jgi:DNA-binding transcriptional LysR family regulator